MRRSAAPASPKVVSRRDDLYDAYQAASHEAQFMSDMRGVAKDFKRAVADGLRDD